MPASRRAASARRARSASPSAEPFVPPEPFVPFVPPEPLVPLVPDGEEGRSEGTPEEGSCWDSSPLLVVSVPPVVVPLPLAPPTPSPQPSPSAPCPGGTRLAATLAEWASSTWPWRCDSSAASSRLARGSLQGGRAAGRVAGWGARGSSQQVWWVRRELPPQAGKQAHMPCQSVASLRVISVGGALPLGPAARGPSHSRVDKGRLLPGCKLQQESAQAAAGAGRAGDGDAEKVAGLPTGHRLEVAKAGLEPGVGGREFGVGYEWNLGRGALRWEGGTGKWTGSASVRCLCLRAGRSPNWLGAARRRRGPAAAAAQAHSWPPTWCPPQRACRRGAPARSSWWPAQTALQ